MKLYIKSNKYQNLLDNLVDGNQLWNPLEGRFETVPEETLAEWRNPKPDLLDGLNLSNYYIYRNGKLGWRSVNGEHTDNARPYRNAGRYKIYLDSYGDVQLPQSRLFVADTETGDVYERSIIHNMGDFKRDLTELIDWLREGNTLEGV